MPKPQNTAVRSAEIRKVAKSVLESLGLGAGSTIDGMTRYNVAKSVSEEAKCHYGTAKAHIDAVLSGKELTKRGGARKGTGPKPKQKEPL